MAESEADDAVTRAPSFDASTRSDSLQFGPATNFVASLSEFGGGESTADESLVDRDKQSSAPRRSRLSEPGFSFTPEASHATPTATIQGRRMSATLQSLDGTLGSSMNSPAQSQTGPNRRLSSPWIATGVHPDDMKRFTTWARAAAESSTQVAASFDESATDPQNQLREVDGEEETEGLGSKGDGPRRTRASAASLEMEEGSLMLS
jgi:hypothetical protein